jgi:hypothetical protein
MPALLDRRGGLRGAVARPWRRDSVIGTTTLTNLAVLRPYTSRRFSSYDTTGGNIDNWKFQPGETRVIAQASGPGCIKHIWMTTACAAPAFARRVVLRMWWDGEATPSVECPLGDFFGLGHGLFKNFVSLPLQMSPENGRGLNCWFPMPFSDGMRIEVTNECAAEVFTLYFYVDWEQYADPAATRDLARFHAQWRRENPTQGFEIPGGPDRSDPAAWRKAYWEDLKNTDGAGNYVILEATGRGHYVGCHLDIDCFERQMNDWYGEGDDMIFVDGEPWPPAIHGTGTEDYFSMAYCPTQEYQAPYHGLILYGERGGWRWKGKQSVYRYHIEDPIAFQRSIRVTIEHGHGNKLSNDYSSTAYWYQAEPHGPFPPLPPVAARLPRPDEPEYVFGRRG